METTENNRVMGTICGIVLVLFASLIAPKLPKEYTAHLEDPWLRFAIFLVIAFIATRDLVTAVIAVIAVMIAYQTFAVQKITDTVMDKTKQLLGKLNKENIIRNLNNLNNKILSNDEKHVKFDEPLITAENKKVLKKTKAALDETIDVLDETKDVLDKTKDVLNTFKKSIKQFIKQIRTTYPAITNDEIVKGIIAENPDINVKVINECLNEVNKEMNIKDIKISDIEMSINNNDVNFVKGNNVVLQKQKKMLQGNIENVQFDIKEQNALPLDIQNSVLTESCSKTHGNNFKCTVEKPINFNGNEEDFSNYATV